MPSIDLAECLSVNASYQKLGLTADLRDTLLSSSKIILLDRRLKAMAAPRSDPFANKNQRY
jgi:hypothetical protein